MHSREPAIQQPVRVGMERQVELVGGLQPRERGITQFASNLPDPLLIVETGNVSHVQVHRVHSQAWKRAAVGLLDGSARIGKARHHPDPFPGIEIGTRFAQVVLGRMGQIDVRCAQRRVRQVHDLIVTDDDTAVWAVERPADVSSEAPVPGDGMMRLRRIFGYESVN